MPPLRQHVLHTAVHVMCGTTRRATPHDITQAEGGRTRWSAHASFVFFRAESGTPSRAAAAPARRSIICFPWRCLHHCFPGTGTPRFRPAVAPFVPQCTHTTEHRQNSRVECCRPQATKPRGVRRQRVGRQPKPANHRTRPRGPWHTIGHATVTATPAATTARPARPIARPHPSLGRPAGLMAPVTILCHPPPSNYQLRMLHPEITTNFAAAHDVAVATCFTQLLDTAPLPATALATAHLPLQLGGLGLTSAVATARPAYWASWADTLPILHAQAPPLAATIRHQLTHPQEATASVRAAIHSAEHLRQHGWEPPAWDQLLNREILPEPHQDFETPALGRGWQQAATRVCNRSFRTELIQAVDPASHSMLESGPNASRPFTTIPYNQSTTYPSHLFRTLLLRRLRLPLPLSARQCRCRRALDLLGDHRAACPLPQAGILRSRGVALERAAARICREAGARVSNQHQGGRPQLGTSHPSRWQTHRRSHCQWPKPLGRSSTGPSAPPLSPLWLGTGSILAAVQAPTPGQLSIQPAGVRNALTPEFLQSRRCRLVVLAFETGGRWSHEATNFIRLFAQSKARQAPALLQRSVMAAIISRWSAMLSHAAMQSFAASLLDQNLSTHSNVDGNTPPVSQLLAATPPPPPGNSRLPPS